MRPGLVFVGLFAVLMVVYFLLKDSLGVLPTFFLQAAIVIVILVGAVWYRFAGKRKAWFFFRVEDDDDDDESQSGTPAGTAGNASSDKIRKAS